MRIKKIEIIGFKSFADREVVHVDDHITAVIGPNGCGKSNIVDATRWCLGEQRAKNLRGGGTSTWDVINLNNAWQRKLLYPEGLILPLDIAKFKPLYDMNVDGFKWPYHWAMDDSGEKLLGMIQRYAEALGTQNVVGVSRRPSRSAAHT